MKQVLRNPFRLFKSLVFTALILLITGTNYAQPDTLYAIGQLAPYDVNHVDSLNFPLRLAEPIGDINGDGLCDFVVNTGWAFNEKTDDPNDFIPKSAIITDISQPHGTLVLNNTNIQGIGDYNGDGYDDMVDLLGHVILLGRSSGQGFNTINVDFPAEMENVLFKDDISGDGKSDFILGGYDHDSLYIYSQEYESYKALSMYMMWTTIDSYFIDFYDYDGDGTEELLVATYSFSNFMFKWFVYDGVSDEFSVEKQKNLPPIHAPSTHYSNFMADMNGDGLKDICHTYYGNGAMNLEVRFGSNTSTNYFSEPVEIEMGNKNRLIYCAGDVNHDGADDWYSKVAVDTIIMYYGSDSVATHGFNTALFPIESNELIVPYAKNPNFLSPVNNLKAFDYDGDSFSDILLSYWSFNESKQYDTSGMVILMGSDNPDFNDKLVFGDAEPVTNTKDGFGTKVLNIGDFNHDGFEDWAVLAAAEKYIDIYYGGAVMDYAYDKQILLPQMPTSQCLDMVFGDLNNDGWIDLAVSNGNLLYEVGFVSSLIPAIEEVYVFYGGPDMPDVVDWRDAEAILDGFEDDYHAYGRSLAIPGDYNNDGFNDLIVGGGQSFTSDGVYMYFGGDQFASEPGLTLISSIGYGNYYFGYPATSCGDINNDGYRDFTLGAGSLQNSNGKSLIYFGGPFYHHTQDMVLDNPTPDGRNFGTFTPRIEGDFNHDGIPDLAHYDPYDTLGASLYIYKGGQNMDNTIDLYLSDTARLYQLRSIEYVPDFSEKNKSDILLMSGYNDPNLLLFTGCDHDKTSVDYIFKNSLKNVGSVASGDFNNDGHTDVLVGNSNSAAAGWAPWGVVQHYVSPMLVGTNEEPMESFTSLSVAPNPANDHILVTYNSKSNEKITLTICNLAGAEVYKMNGQSNESNTININHLKSGVYVVSVLSSGKTERTKIVKI